MIKRTHEVNIYGNYIYENVLTGERGELGFIKVDPSQRRNNRSKAFDNRIRTNRKTTRGRNIYFQKIGSKVIKHFQETFASLKRKEAYLKFTNRFR